jgi:4-hydroxybutyrate CoA-transferase
LNWRELYKNRLKTADEAVSFIKSGDRIVVSHASGSPESVLDAMVRNKDRYRNVEIDHMVCMSRADYCLPENGTHFIHNSLFTSGVARKAIEEGRAFFTPSHFSQIPRLFTDGILPVDVTLCMVSPPDEHGFCSFGVSVDYTKPAAGVSKTVIAAVSPHMPRTFGDSFIHVSEIDHIVETEDKPIVLNPPKITDVDAKIGGFCAELINDGDCLQLGIGAVPDSILGFLKDKKDLGVHSEMFSDGAVDLVEAGVITCARKNYNKGVMVANFLMGTEKLYRFVHDNPMVAMHPADYTNNPAIVARNDNMVSVNATLQIDLTGQASSETLGYRHYSGSGGQADFIRGAAWSRGGRSILALHSTASGGKVSRIVCALSEGAVVTTTRTDIHYVVTEYGIANLRGKSVPERAKALIAIAHPDFRGELRKQFNTHYRYGL